MNFQNLWGPLKRYRRELNSGKVWSFVSVISWCSYRPSSWLFDPNVLPSFDGLGRIEFSNVWVTGSWFFFLILTNFSSSSNESKLGSNGKCKVAQSLSWVDLVELSFIKFHVFYANFKFPRAFKIVFWLADIFREKKQKLSFANFNFQLRIWWIWIFILKF